ncbi:MAG: hypothetical protein R6X23_02385 [Acidimicrobiia bacterium]
MPDGAAKPSLGERLGWRAERRPVAGFAHVLAAGAGLFLVIAAIALAAEVASDDLTAPGVLASLIVAAAAFAIGMRLPGPARSACVAALATITPVLWFFAFLGDGESGGSGSVRAILLLCLAVYVALYLLGWTAGRAIFLGLALVFLAAWINFEVAGGDAVAPFQNEISGETGFDTPFGDGGSSNGFDSIDSDDDTDVVSLILGLAFLGAAAGLDKKGRAGAATPFLAVGALLAVVGAASLGGQESVVLGGLLTAAAGALVGWIGARGEGRRGSVWIGGIVVVFGLLAVIGDLAGDSALGLAGLAALVAAGLVALGIVLAPKLEEPVDGDATATAG